MDQWLCTWCGKGFVHARLLASHLERFHARQICKLMG